MDPLVIHEYRDRAVLLRDLLEEWFQHEALEPARCKVGLAIVDLQHWIDGLSPGPGAGVTQEQQLAETLRQCRSALQTAMCDVTDPVARRVITRRIESADRVLARMPRFVG